MTTRAPRDPATRPLSDEGWEMTVSAFGLTAAELEAMFDRVATAAHALDESVTCFGWTPVPPAAATEETRDDH